MTAKMKGSCLCGSIQYEYKNPFSFSLCHCDMCRQHTGSAFGAFIGINAEDFKFTKGKEKFYKSSDWAHRAFCENCGSTLRYIFDKAKDKVFVAAGTVYGDPGIRPKKHIFIRDKSCWFEITDDIAQFEEI